jgi:crotonobetainyl-CoA:carnitine CoA-transferase CaiB-like acyl-CoA transferase
MMTNQPAPAGPLSDLTVIDLTAALAGPYATLLLAGLGAQVIKIEPPGRGETARSNAPYTGRDGLSLIRRHDDDMSLAIVDRARNKKSVTLNLKHHRAKDVFADLVRGADVVVENFTRGTVDRLGVGYAFASAVNPRVVYCSISGFGSAGEPGTGKAMDTIIQALSGLMFTSGAPDEPPVRVGIPLGDLTAPLFAVIGILSAVHLARRTGLGQHVDVSMLGALTSLVACEPVEALRTVGIPTRTGNTVPRLAPFGIFQARDGYFALCAPTDAFAAGVLRAIGKPDLISDDRFSSRDHRVGHADELHCLIGQWARDLSQAEAVARLEAEGVPAAAVREPGQAIRDPQVISRGETTPLRHPDYGTIDGVVGSGMPIRFSRSAADLTRPAPALGQHNSEILGGVLGYPEALLAELAAAGVI